MKDPVRIARAAAVVIVAAAGLAGLAFLSLGEPANHPQIEMARTAVSELQQGAAPATVIPGRAVDIATSTDPFVIVTDSQHNVLASSATLSGNVVLPPPGVFDLVRRDGEDRVTWQPAPGVRAWIVVDAFRDGFVVAGRSPAGTEQSEYVLVLWGSVAALALAGIAGLALVVTARLGGGGGS